MKILVDSQVLFQHGILSFRLTIRLGMEGKRAGGPYAIQLQQPSPKMGCEHLIAITDQRFWKAVNLDHVLEKQGCDIRSRHGFCGRDEECLLSQAIDHHQNCVMIVARRQVHKSIQRHTAPGPGRDR